MLFSQRKGIKSTQKIIQLDDIDEDLRNRLWNSLKIFYWDTIHYGLDHWGYVEESNLEALFQRLWHLYFKKPLDALPPSYAKALKIVRANFFECEWYEVYDLIEFIANNGPENFQNKFCDFANDVLESENSGYRFVDGKLIEISSQQEVSEIEEAIKLSTPYYGVKQHLQAAIALLSDKKSPDYRNSIKESISAVESLARHITGNEKATLGDALSIIEKHGKLHGALKKSFSALYGYTSDEDGIRHAMLEEAELSSADAKFMLVSCSAFVNYIIDKHRI